MNAVLIVVAVAVGVVIGRQLRGEPLRGKRVVLLPLVLTGIGAVNLADLRHLSAADVACIAIGAVIAAAIGVRQGTTMRLESRDGGLWGQLPIRGLWLWGALLASRLAFAVIAVPLGAHAVSSVDSIIFVLGVNRLAQAAAIAFRAVAAGIPFAAEKDGKTFLPSLFGQAEPATAPCGSFTPGVQTSPAASRSSRPSGARTAAMANRASWSDVARLLADRFAARP